MSEDETRDCSLILERLYQESSRKVYATLVRVLGDLELAEEGLQLAFATASEQWPTQGVPQNPIAWLISTGRFKLIDRLRRQERFKSLEGEVVERQLETLEWNQQIADREIEDDRLRLIFTCCHPAIDQKVQVPLTLREVCGLSTEEIASAFLTTSVAMAQRIVRGKAKIKAAAIPYHIPEREELPARLNTALAVVYLVYNEGYSASRGENLLRADLTQEAIRLGRLIVGLLPEPEAKGLLALMLLHESRREARTDAKGDIILLEEQDRSLWNEEYIREGTSLVREIAEKNNLGFYSLQAAISATHAQAAHSDDTRWDHIVSLYDSLLEINPSAVIRLNRAVAVAMRDGYEKGVELIHGLHREGELLQYLYSHSALGELYRRMGNTTLARTHFETALGLCNQEAEQRFIHERLARLEAEPTA